MCKGSAGGDQALKIESVTSDKCAEYTRSNRQHIMRLPRLATVRITLLLVLLIAVGGISTHQHIYTRNWNQPLQITVFPINGDGSRSTNAYIASLDTSDFASIDGWSRREARRHNLALERPLSVRLGDRVDEHPPEYPQDRPTAIDVLLWGLRFRWWAFRNTPEDNGGLTRIRLFVVYHKGEDDKPLAHSLGLKKGLLGLVHAYALHEQTAQNAIVIAHEVLHTVGAIDKYGEFGKPVFPYGYANPARQPLYPQRSAEIMAVRIPTSPHSSYMAESLRSVIINRHTAAEINWLDP